jgi:hypothetical protein
MPADHGLTGLGLLMQLGGTIFLVMYAYIAIVPLLLPGGGMGNETWWWFLFAASSAVRSAFHRAAGKALVHGSANGPLQPTRIYIAVSLVHTVIAVYAMHKLFAPMAEFSPEFTSPILSLIAMCVAWPATLAVVVTRKRFQAFEGTTLPQSEDMGFEGVAVLMSLMGVFGTVIIAFSLLSVLKAAGSPVASGEVFFLVLILIALLIRSFLHAKAGITGVRGTDPHVFHDKAQSYYNFGVVAAMLTGAGMLIISFQSKVTAFGILPIGMLVYLLLVWPIMMKRFFMERNFSLLIQGEDAPVLRRAPDAGLTSLGWLLIATSVTGFAIEIASLISEPSGGGNQMLLFAMQFTGELAPGGIERWLPLASTALQLWAGIELVSMSDRHRMAANVFGVFGLVSAMVLYWDVFKSFSAFGNAIGANGTNPFGGAMEALLPIVSAMVVPIAVLLLINRKNVATARVLPRTAAERSD